VLRFIHGGAEMPGMGVYYEAPGNRGQVLGQLPEGNDYERQAGFLYEKGQKQKGLLL